MAKIKAWIGENMGIVFLLGLLIGGCVLILAQPSNIHYSSTGDQLMATQIYELRQDVHSLQTQVAKQDSR